jgi:hypothetical protein
VNRVDVLLVARDAWLEGRDWRAVLTACGIDDVAILTDGFPMKSHDRIEWDWLLDDALAVMRREREERLWWTPKR